MTRIHWLVQETVSVALIADQSSYPLSGLFAGQEIIFPVAAAFSANESNHPVEIIGREKYLDIVRRTTSGEPAQIYIDRLGEPTMAVYPVPSATEGVIELVAQTTTLTFSPQGIASTGSGNVGTQMPAAWQNWAIYRLAYHLGDGSVRSLPGDELKRLDAIAERSLQRLLAFENREHISAPHVTSFRDF